MKRLLLGLMTLSMLGLTACNGALSQNDKLQARSASAASGKNDTARADKPTGENTPQDVRELLKHLELAHQMFEQIWFKIHPSASGAALSNSRPQITSPFLALKKRLLRHQEKNTGWLENFDLCPQWGRSQIVLEKQQADGRELIKKLQLFHSPCERHTRDLVAEIAFQGNRLDLTLRRDSLPDGFGSSALLGREATCQILIGENHRIEKLRCAGLGQGLGSTPQGEAISFIFDTFQYDRNAVRTMMKVQGSKYLNLEKRCESQDPCTLVEVTLDKILISENLIQAQDRATRERERMRLEHEAAKAQAAANQSAIEAANRQGPAGMVRPGGQGRGRSNDAPAVRDLPDALRDGETIDRAARTNGRELRLRDRHDRGQQRQMTEAERRQRMGLSQDDEIPRPGQQHPRQIAPAPQGLETSAPAESCQTEEECAALEEESEQGLAPMMINGEVAAEAQFEQPGGMTR